MAKSSEEPRALTRKDFQFLAQLRASEAAMLAKNGKSMGAYYLGGLAVECALKACIAKSTKRYQFPRDRKFVDQAYSHDLRRLLELAGLSERLNEDLESNPNFAAKWAIVETWNVNTRYETSGLKGFDMDTAISSPGGVLEWIKQHW